MSSATLGGDELVLLSVVVLERRSLSVTEAATLPPTPPST